MLDLQALLLSVAASFQDGRLTSTVVRAQEAIARERLQEVLFGIGIETNASKARWGYWRSQFKAVTEGLGWAEQAMPAYMQMI